jgi:hypothetical protein
MPWPRLLDLIVDRDECVPAALIVHGFEPMELANQLAIFGPVHSPPSSGGVLIRCLSAASASVVRMVGFVPLWMRWSPSASGPPSL